MRAVICFEPDAGAKAASRALEALRVRADGRCRWFEMGLLSVEMDEPGDPEALERVRRVGGVRRVVALPEGTSLVGRVPPDAVVALAGGARFARGGLSVIAGPCSVESEEQICGIAAVVRAAGAVALRGGAFKPRTSPYAFDGLGERGLELLARAREKTGLPVVTEALDTEHVDVVARHADVIQIGSRNMHNQPLLFRVGAHPSGRPVLLKRGFVATVDELVQAAECVLLGRLFAGTERPNLILCERGIRTFETSLRFTLDVGAIPVLQDRTALPIIADPSHPAGRRRYVPPLARAAVAAGADGLLVEVHTDPPKAWSDSDQSLSPDEFRRLMAELPALRPGATCP